MDTEIYNWIPYCWNFIPLITRSQVEAARVWLVLIEVLRAELL
jgi:hypothetical protein